MTAWGLPRAEGPEQVGLWSARLERLGAVIREDVERRLIPGAVVVIARFESLGIADPAETGDDHDGTGDQPALDILADDRAKPFQPRRREADLFGALGPRQPPIGHRAALFPRPATICRITRSAAIPRRRYKLRRRPARAASSPRSLRAADRHRSAAGNACRSGC